MGEIADMMLGGTLCAGCGSFMEENFDLDDLDAGGFVKDTSPGFPMMCAACTADAGHQVATMSNKKKKRRSRK